MPRHFPQMVMAELRCVFGRVSGKAAVVIALLVGLAVTAFWFYINSRTIDAEVNGLGVNSFLDLSMRGVMGAGLQLRNFFVLPMVLVLATAASFAGERGDNTLREVFVRPVSRWSVVLAKICALMTLSATTLVVTAVPAMLGGAVLFGFESPIGQVALGYVASLLSDLGLVLMVVLASGISARVGGVVVAVIGGLMVDMGARALLGVMNTFGVEWAGPVGRAMPGAALACWEGFDGAWEWERFVGLAALCLICGGISLWRFQRMDVP